MRFQGSYRELPKLRGKTGPRGVLKALKVKRRTDAEERNARTSHDKTKAHRLNRCGVAH